MDHNNIGEDMFGTDHCKQVPKYRAPSYCSLVSRVYVYKVSVD